MFHDNIVVFKGKKDGIVIVLDGAAPFEALKSTLRAKVADARKFFGGAKMSIVFQGRELSETEESELLEIIIQEANLNVSFVKEPEEAPQRAAKADEPAAVNLFDPSEHMLTLHKGALRAGKSIRYAGSVLVMGDVNPGAEVIAEGNIIVLGTIKGMVHAGCTGNTECFVAALCLTPIQLRIADRATYIPEDILKQSKKKKLPSYAYIQDGQIYIAPI